MARAIAARTQGDDYQARWFWLQVCRLFGDRTNVVRVVYEANNVKSFDDVVVHFEGMTDEEGHPLFAEYYQVKFHVTSGGSLTWEGMMAPAFINAQSVSLLQRLKNAQRKHAPTGTEAHFILFSPWDIHPDDLLAKVHSKSDGRLDWHRLSQGGDRSELGKLRAAWRHHLELSSDEELRIVLRPLRIRQGRTLTELQDTLNDKLHRAGLCPVDESCISNPYDELIRKLLQNEQTEFSRSEIEAVCNRENLWMGNTANKISAYQVGFRSFLRWAEHLEDQTDVMLDLLHFFNGRKIKSSDLWQEHIFPSIEQFLNRALQGYEQCDLHLHVHTSIAFAAGYCLDTKSGIDTAVIQSTRSGRMVWRPSVSPDFSKYQSWSFREEPFSEDGTDLALALCVTHDVTSDVRAYLEQENLQVSRILSCSLPSGSNNTAIKDADHAKFLSDQLSNYLRNNRTILERQSKLHLFVAAPNGLTFFIGQTSRSFGPCVLYEYDFDSNVPGAYEPSLRFPPRNQGFYE
jgi:hypothetical protein